MCEIRVTKRKTLVTHIHYLVCVCVCGVVADKSPVEHLINLQRVAEFPPPHRAKTFILDINPLATTTFLPVVHTHN